MSERELDPKERRFVDEYILDLNAERAAIAAGYANSVARKKAHGWVGDGGQSKPHVYAAVLRILAAASSKSRVTVERIVEEYARIGFSNMRDFTEFGPNGVRLKSMQDMHEDSTRCIAEVSETTSKDGGSLKFKLHDKKGALDSLSRYMGMFIDKTEMTGKDGGPIEIESRNTTVDKLITLLQGKMINQPALPSK